MVVEEKVKKGHESGKKVMFWELEPNQKYSVFGCGNPQNIYIFNTPKAFTGFTSFLYQLNLNKKNQLCSLLHHKPHFSPPSISEELSFSSTQMKFLNWIQSKLNGKQVSKQPVGVSTTSKVVLQETPKDEFSDWPHGLLAIGTFGNNDLKDQVNSTSSKKCSGHNQIEEEEEINPSSSPAVVDDDDQLDFTPEEVGQLQEELKMLLSRKPKPVHDQCRMGSGRRGGNGILNLPLDKFLNCPSSLELDRKINASSDDNSNEYRASDLLLRSLSIVANMGKNSSPERTKAIKKKSIAFLLKKFFVCRSGFPNTPAPAPSFRDSIPESRIEKILRAIINRNIYSRSSTPAASAAKKYLEINGRNNILNKTDNHYTEEEDDDRQQQQQQQPKEKVVNEGCKWDKTDTDYIVLEI